MTIPEDLRTAAEAVIADAMAKLNIKALESAGNHKKLIHDTYVEAIARAILADRALHRADPSPQSLLRGIEEGIERAARYIEKQRDEYVQEYGMYDGTTGVTEFSNGGEEYLSTLEELIDGIRALAATEGKENGTNHGCKSDLHPEYVTSGADR